MMGWTGKKDKRQVQPQGQQNGPKRTYGKKKRVQEQGTRKGRHAVQRRNLYYDDMIGWREKIELDRWRLRKRRSERKTFFIF